MDGRPGTAPAGGFAVVGDTLAWPPPWSNQPPLSITNEDGTGHMRPKGQRLYFDDEAARAVYPWHRPKYRNTHIPWTADCGLPSVWRAREPGYPSGFVAKKESE